MYAKNQSRSGNNFSVKFPFESALNSDIRNSQITRASNLSIINISRKHFSLGKLFLFKNSMKILIWEHLALEHPYGLSSLCLWKRSEESSKFKKLPVLQLEEIQANKEINLLLLL